LYLTSHSIQTNAVRSKIQGRIAAPFWKSIVIALYEELYDALYFAEGWTATLGGRAAWREFHDTFLGYGCPPIPLAHPQLMGETHR